MSLFFKIHEEFTAKWEGGLSDDPVDRGGTTAFGVSFKFLKDTAETQDGRVFLQQIGLDLPVTKAVVRRLTYDQALAIFRHYFWNALQLDRLPARPAAIVYDMAVNHGTARAVKLAQRGYNRCVLHGTKLVVDGKLGPLTIAALSKDTSKINSAIIDAREDFYADIVQKDPEQGKYLRGWLNRAKDLRRYMEKLAHV